MTVKELLALLETETNENLKAVVVNVQQNEIAVYSRSDIDLEEYRGWENLKIAFWGVSENRVIIYSAVEREEAPAPKEKRMTCREWIARHHPEKVEKTHGGTLEKDKNGFPITPGGCCGCPNMNEGMESVAQICCELEKYARLKPQKLCERCWSQPVPEGVED